MHASRGSVVYLPLVAAVFLLCSQFLPGSAAGHVHSNHTSRLTLLSTNPLASPVAASGRLGKGYCSCAKPAPLPLLLDKSTNTQATPSSGAAAEADRAAAEADHAAAEADAELLGGRHAHPSKGNCHKLPTSSPGGDCGAAIGVCPKVGVS